jgi:hypothetical protein
LDDSALRQEPQSSATATQRRRVAKKHQTFDPGLVPGSRASFRVHFDPLKHSRANRPNSLTVEAKTRKFSKSAETLKTSWAAKPTSLVRNIDLKTLV